MSNKLLVRKALTRGREGWVAKICGVFPDVIGRLHDKGGFVRDFQVTAKEEKDGTYFYVSVGSSGSKIRFKF